MADEQRLLDAPARAAARAAPRAPPRGRSPACAAAAAGPSGRGRGASRRSRGGRWRRPARAGKSRHSPTEPSPSCSRTIGRCARTGPFRDLDPCDFPTYPRGVRLVTWNVAGRVRRQAEQAEVVAACDADVVALQEVTKRTLPEWEAALRAAGYAAIECALGGPASGRRELGVLTAARGPLERLPSPDVPWPERVLCCAWEASRSSTSTRRSRPRPSSRRSAPTRPSPPTSKPSRAARGSCAATSTRRAASCPTARS